MTKYSTVVTPPTFFYKQDDTKPSIFLAGSIEMGVAENWQDKAIEMLDGYASVIYNPRRDDWDSSWEQSIRDPQFNVQVNWELEMLEQAEYVIVNIVPDTKSPITLMELGMLAARKPKSTVVCCPDGFWRKGNVEVICNRYGVIMFEEFDNMISCIRTACMTYPR